ncbi:hypothetical protein EON65_43295 [archaeon]|nr:MAG: hypothetical protein EON65_43295 [archaeon]
MLSEVLKNTMGQRISRPYIAYNDGGSNSKCPVSGQSSSQDKKESACPISGKNGADKAPTEAIMQQQSSEQCPMRDNVKGKESYKNPTVYNVSSAILQHCSSLVIHYNSY